LRTALKQFCQPDATKEYAESNYYRTPDEDSAALVAWTPFWVDYARSVLPCARLCVLGDTRGAAEKQMEPGANRQETTGSQSQQRQLT